MREIDKLKAQIGKKIADIELKWDDLFEDYFMESITFEDGTVVEVWGRADLVQWSVEKWEGETS